MKIKTKAWLIVIAAIFSAITLYVAVAVVPQFVALNTVHPFSMSENSNIIEQQKDINSGNYSPVGYIENAVAAKKAADKLFKDFDVDFQKGTKQYKVYFDEENQVWKVAATVFVINEFVDVGPMVILNKSDGKVIAIWREKF